MDRHKDSAVHETREIVQAAQLHFGITDCDEVRKLTDAIEHFKKHPGVMSSRAAMSHSAVKKQERTNSGLHAHYKGLSLWLELSVHQQESDRTHQTAAPASLHNDSAPPVPGRGKRQDLGATEWAKTVDSLPPRSAALVKSASAKYSVDMSEL